MQCMASPWQGLARDGRAKLLVSLAWLLNDMKIMRLGLGKLDLCVKGQEPLVDGGSMVSLELFLKTDFSKTLCMVSIS